MTQYTILSTKKVTDWLKEQSEKKSIRLLEEAFIKTEHVPGKEKEVLQLVQLPDDTAVAFTSRHGVDSTAANLADTQPQWKIFCLEGTTRAAVIAQMPMGAIVDIAPDAAALAAKIIAYGSFNTVVFFCGNKRRDELPHLLREKDIAVKEVIVYETIETPVPVKDDLDAVLFFSPSAASSFFSINKMAAKTICFAIGATTAEAIARYTNNTIITSAIPDADSLVSSALLYFEQLTTKNEHIKK